MSTAWTSPTPIIHRNIYKMPNIANRNHNNRNHSNIVTKFGFPKKQEHL